jgi:hypothetical protein
VTVSTEILQKLLIHVAGIAWRARPVIWIITIAAFLFTIVFLVSVYLLYSQRGRIRDAFKKIGLQEQEKRISRRRAERVRLELSSLDGTPISEITVTENVSHHGARVVTKNRWEPLENVQVKFLSEARLAHAQIAYCNPSGNEFATGLQFSVAISPLIGHHKP